MLTGMGGNLPGAGALLTGLVILATPMVFPRLR